MDMTNPPMNRDNTTAAAKTAAEQQPALVPAVDVFEDENGITLKADLPGVSKENLSVHVEADQLTIEGQVSLGASERLEPVYAEVRVAQYRRTFALSRDLDTEKIDASMKNGVLTLRIPKGERAKPRRVPVSVA